MEYDNLHIQIKTQLLEELCGIQCEKGEKCVRASVGSAQTPCKDVGGNRNLTDNKIFQRANLPKANRYGHKHLTLRRCAELRQRNIFRASWRHSRAMGTAQRGACPATSSALGFWWGTSLLLVSMSLSVKLGWDFPFLVQLSRASACRILYSSQKKTITLPNTFCKGNNDILKVDAFPQHYFFSGFMARFFFKHS